MPAGLSPLVAAVRGAADPEALWRVLVDWLRGQGVRTVVYHHFTGSLATDPAPVIAAEGLPEALVRRYVSEKVYRLNPRPDLLSEMTDPVDWHDLPALETALGAAAPDLAEAVEALGRGEGLSLPVFGPGGRGGTFGLGFGEGRREADPDLPRRLQLGCQLAHLAYCRMTPAAPPSPGAELSPREREVLGWIARGKSNGVIAEILGISPHTVDTHVRRLFDKLGVTDRTTAAVKGLGAGLVQPPRPDHANDAA